MKQQKITDAMRVNYRKNNAIDRQVRKHRIAKGKPLPKLTDKIRITPLGGQNGIGEKNMIIVEYGNDAIVLDCGFELGIDLPGINYAIPATDYLESIKHKLRGYIISRTHGSYRWISAYFTKESSTGIWQSVHDRDGADPVR